LRCHFVLNTPSIYQDRFGTNIGKALKKEMVCFRRNDLLGKAELVDAGNKTAEVRKKAFFFWTGPVPDPSAGCQLAVPSLSWQAFVVIRR